MSVEETIKSAIDSGRGVKILHCDSRNFLFVNAIIEPGAINEDHDAILCSIHAPGALGLFKLEDCGGGRYRLYNDAANRFVFVSEDSIGRDYIVKAHDPGHIAEDRNEFEFQPTGEGDKIWIRNPHYDRYLFVSRDTCGSFSYNIVEAHAPKYIAETRNIFQLVLADKTP